MHNITLMKHGFVSFSSDYIRSCKIHNIV